MRMQSITTAFLLAEITLYAVTFVLFVNKQTVIIKAFDYAKSLIEVCERILVPILNLKNSRFFTFSALNASFLSTQGKTLPIFGRVFALSGYRRLLPIIME